MPGMKDAIAGWFKGGVTGIGDSVKGIIAQVAENKIGLSEASLAIDKEINRASEAATELLLKDKTIQAELEKAYLLDVQNARDANVKVQGDNPSWLAKNVAFLLDIAITTGFFSLIGMIAYKVVPEQNKELFYMVVGILGAKWGDVVAFHRGSSKGSEDKGKIIDRMSKH